MCEVVFAWVVCLFRCLSTGEWPDLITAALAEHGRVLKTSSKHTLCYCRCFHVCNSNFYS